MNSWLSELLGFPSDCYKAVFLHCNILTNSTSERGLILNNKEQGTWSKKTKWQIKNGDPNTEFSIEETQKVEKQIFNILNQSGKCKWKLLWDYITLSLWLRSILQITAHIGKDVE